MSKAAWHRRLANIRKEGSRGHFRAPLQSPAPLTRLILQVDCCLSFFWSFVDPEGGEAAVFSSPAPPSNQISDPGVRGHFRDPLHFRDVGAQGGWKGLKVWET